jgi:integrase
MVNRENYLLTKAYLGYLREVVQLDVRSTQRYWFYLRHLLLWADATPFSQASMVQPTFPTYLSTVRAGGGAETLAPGTCQGLSPTTLKKIAQTAKRFFTWAKMTYSRRFRAVSKAWIDALRPPRSVQPAPKHEFVTLDEVKQLAALKVPEQDLALRRDQAAASLLFVSGMRAGALGSLPIEALDLPNRAVKQWPSLGVATKNGKSATTYLLDIPELLSVIGSWDAFIRAHFSPDAAWYAPTDHNWEEQRLSTEPVGSNRNVAIARRMRKLFSIANLPYKSPHKFRHGHAVYALQHARTMADYKAISMNLMHADIRVTDGIYAPLTSDEVKQRVACLTGQAPVHLPADGDLTEFLRGLSDTQLSQALVVAAERLTR